MLRLALPYLTVSEAPKEVVVQKKYDSRRELDEYKSDEQKKRGISCCHGE